MPEQKRKQRSQWYLASAVRLDRSSSAMLFRAASAC